MTMKTAKALVELSVLRAKYSALSECAAHSRKIFSEMLRDIRRIQSILERR